MQPSMRQQRFQSAPGFLLKKVVTSCPTFPGSSLNLGIILRVLDYMFMHAGSNFKILN